MTDKKLQLVGRKKDLLPDEMAKFKAIIEQRSDDIERWFSKQYTNAKPFFYSSVDIRHSGYKIAPVDTNLFPAGFNLLSKKNTMVAVKEIQEYFSKYYPVAKKVLLVPERHTRNLYYLDNVVRIRELLELSELEVRIGGLDLEADIKLESASGKKLNIEKLLLDGKRLRLDSGFTPDIILVNNDFSSGAPEIMQDIDQPIIPPVGMGWYRRRKTNHFDTYSEVARSFAKKFDFDEWLISTIFTKCGTVNFKEKKGLECVAVGVEKTLSKIRKKYKRYGIEDEPYVFIKADSGTYGMGIMVVRSSEELYEINKKERNKMNAIKEGVHNSEVIIQEGVQTIDKIDGNVAEPMIYMINGQMIGCTYRVNSDRDSYGNLNSKGMTFKNVCELDSETAEYNEGKDLCPVQSLIARLASLAATRECYEPRWDI